MRIPFAKKVSQANFFVNENAPHCLLTIAWFAANKTIMLFFGNSRCDVWISLQGENPENIKSWNNKIIKYFQVFCLLLFFCLLALKSAEKIHLKISFIAAHTQDDNSIKILLPMDVNKNSICKVTCELYVRDGIFGELSTHNKSDCLIGMLKRHKGMRDA